MVLWPLAEAWPVHTSTLTSSADTAASAAAAGVSCAVPLACGKENVSTTVATWLCAEYSPGAHKTCREATTTACTAPPAAAVPALRLRTSVVVLGSSMQPSSEVWTRRVTGRWRPTTCRLNCCGLAVVHTWKEGKEPVPVATVELMQCQWPRGSRGASPSSKATLAVHVSSIPHMPNIPRMGTPPGKHQGMAL